MASCSEEEEPEEPLTLAPFPDETVYEPAGTCCGIEKFYVPAIGKYFLRHWEIQKCFPCFVITVQLSSFLVFLFAIVPTTRMPLVFSFLVSAIFCLFLASYIQTILEGPGYLPFYYPMTPANKFSHCKGDYLKGLVVNKEQESYIKSQKLPNRAHFFRSARRVVLRPDHFCDWVGSFIGKKNYKLFYLFNMYGFVYITSFVICACYAIKVNLEQKTIPYSQIPIVGYLILAFFFMLFTMMFFCGSSAEISQNVTDFENLSKTKVTWDTSSCINNWEEVFGSIRKWYTWLIPIGAFHGIDEYELANGRDGFVSV